MEKIVLKEIKHPCIDCITFPVCKQKAYLRGGFDMGPVYDDCSIITDVANLLDESGSEIEPLTSMFRK